MDNQGKISESEVIKKMADNKNNQNEAQKTNDQQDVRPAEATGVQQSALDKLKKMSGAAKPAEATKEEPKAEVSTTSEFNTTDAEETKSEEERVSATTEGVRNYVEYPETEMNKMPEEEGAVALEPNATWIKDRNIVGGKTIAVEYGRFWKNSKGEKVEVVTTKRTVVRPEVLVRAEKIVAKAGKDVEEAAKAISNPNAKRLREYMSDKSMIHVGIVDHNNVPTIKTGFTKDNKDTLTGVSFKVGETGYGSVSGWYAEVPARAFDLLRTGQTFDEEQVNEIVNEANPEFRLHFIPKDEQTHFITAYTSKGIKINPAMVSQQYCNKVISTDPTQGVVPRLYSQYVGMKTYKNETGSAEEELKIKKKQENDTKRYNKLVEKFGSDLNAIMAMEYRLKSSFSNKIVLPDASIPKKIYSTIRAGASFRPSEELSAERATQIYIEPALRKKFAEGATFDAISVAKKDDKRPYLFNVEMLPDGVGTNPVFYNTGETCIVEPYMPTFVPSAGKAIKSQQTTLSVLGKKVPNKKNDGSYVWDATSIVDEGYSMSIYNAVRDRYEASAHNVPFPSVEQIRKDITKSKKSTSARSSRLSNVANIDFLADLDNFEKAMVRSTNSSLMANYEAAKSRIASLKKDDSSKTQMWGIQYTKEVNRYKKVLDVE